MYVCTRSPVHRKSRYPTKISSQWACLLTWHCQQTTLVWRMVSGPFLAKALLQLHTSPWQAGPLALFPRVIWWSPSREMLVISRQNGLRLLSSRLSGYRQKATRWSAAAMICTDRLRVKLKDLRGGVPVGRFFPFFFCWLLHRADVLHLRITSRFTFLFVVLWVCEWQGCSRTWRSL